MNEWKRKWVNIRKRGKVYQYQFEIAKLEGKRKYISKSICVFLMACYTGMRTGEVFALTWDDIDLGNRIIKINKTYL